MYSGLGWVMGVWDWGEIQDYSGKGRLPENSASGECGFPIVLAHKHIIAQVLPYSDLRLQIKGYSINL